MSEIGVKLRNLAFQRRAEDYGDVLEFLSALQNRKMSNQVLDGDDYEAIEIAQSYLRNVDDPRKQPPIEKRRSHGISFA